jgi:uncharacterized membrane-anchored protein YhcB (DUF1043 family)
MEMFYFTLGVLTVIALTLVGVVVLGMGRVQKLQKDVQSSKESYRWDFENQHRRLDEHHREIQERFSNFYRDFEKLHQECTSYTDKRIDKAIYQYKEKES